MSIVLRDIWLDMDANSIPRLCPSNINISYSVYRDQPHIAVIVSNEETVPTAALA